MRARIIAIAFLSAVAGGCVGIPHTRVEGTRLFTCVDGVEYFESSGRSDNLTPHLKPDGKPYACNY